MRPLKRYRIGKQNSCLNLGTPLELRHRLQLKVDFMYQMMILGTNTMNSNSEETRRSQKRYDINGGDHRKYCEAINFK